MKYKDKFITISTPNLVMADIERPIPAMIDLFNPPNNLITVQTFGILSRAICLLSNHKEAICLGVGDKRLHCLIPSLMYVRSNPEDKYFTVSNDLVIKESELARELIKSNLPEFLSSSRDIVHKIFRHNLFTYLLFNIDDMETIATSIDIVKKTRGIVAVHNIEYKNTTQLTRYTLEKNILPTENPDGSFEIACL